MALNFSETKKRVDYGRVEDGTYPARVVRIIDFGLQYATDFKTGEVKKYDDGNDVIQHKVWIDFELPTETIDIDGVKKPRWYGKEYTVSSHEKAAIQALLKAADPDGKATMKGKNVVGLLGLPVMLTIGSTSTGNGNLPNTGTYLLTSQIQIKLFAQAATIFSRVNAPPPPFSI